MALMHRLARPLSAHANLCLCFQTICEWAYPRKAFGLFANMHVHPKQSQMASFPYWHSLRRSLRWHKRDVMCLFRQVMLLISIALLPNLLFSQEIMHTFP